MDFFTVPTITFGVLLLLRDQLRSSAHPAFQCYKPSDEPVDRAAATGGVSIRVGAQVSDLRPGCEIRVGGCSGRHGCKSRKVKVLLPSIA